MPATLGKLPEVSWPYRHLLQRYKIATVATLAALQTARLHATIPSTLGKRHSSRPWRKWEAMAATTHSKRANLTAKRKERIPLPKYDNGRHQDFPISEFFKHPSGIEALLNTRALQSYEPIDSHTYRCTLHKIRLLNADVVPVMDLRVTPTSEDCTVEMLSCTFVGPETVQKQNEVFSAFMINHITWEDNVLEPYLEVDVVMKITLEVFTVRFNLLPVSVVETPGNLVMQGLIDRFVPLLGEQILQDYHAWIEERFRFSSQHSRNS